MSIIVDYTTIIDTERKVGAYVGAGNFTRELILNLKEKSDEIKAVVYDDFVPKEGIEKLVFSDIRTILFQELSLIKFTDADVLLFPATNGYAFEKIRRIKRKKKVKVYAIVHDKQHNIKHYDRYDRFYNTGIDRLLVVNFAKWFVKHTVFDFLYPVWISKIDKLITVSNYSLQTLANNKAKRVVLFYQGTSVTDSCIEKENAHLPTGSYILFVSGNRSEKNLARALLAYQKFIKETDSSLKICITGITKQKLLGIARGMHIDDLFVNSNVVFYNYVKEEELKSLYKNCRYLLFVSKGEGFGLPVLEAMQFSKTVLASFQTSVPEVAGSVLYYVNAYDIDSICDGMKYLANDEYLRYREYLVNEKLDIIKRQIDLDRRVFLDEILK